MTTSYRQALDLIGCAVPGHLAADAEVPVLTGAQAQGDVLVFPAAPPADADWQPVPDQGLALLRGEAAGNTHWLHRGLTGGGVRWAPPDPWDDDVALGHLRVPDGVTALLIHTDEHGANAIGPGCYALHRKREWRPETATPTLLGD